MSGFLLLLLSHLVSSNTLPAYQSAPAVGLTRSVDIIQQTRTQAESLKRDLRNLASTPGDAQKILNKVFTENNDVCMNTVEEAIQAIEASTKLVENAGTEIKQLIQAVQVFENITDTPTAVRETAKIIRILDVLIPKITPATPSSVCGPSSGDEFASLRSIGVIVDELSSKTDLYINLQKKQNLKTSAMIVSDVANFLTQLKKSFSKFDQFCTKDKEYNIEVITAIGEMMTDLADLYRLLGGLTAAKQISKQGDFTKKVVVSTAGISQFYSFLFILHSGQHEQTWRSWPCHSGL
jgi:flagellar biosynthesis chaperone FliJ